MSTTETVGETPGARNGGDAKHDAAPTRWPAPQAAPRASAVRHSPDAPRHRAAQPTTATPHQAHTVTATTTATAQGTTTRGTTQPTTKAHANRPLALTEATLRTGCRCAQHRRCRPRSPPANPSPRPWQTCSATWTSSVPKSRAPPSSAMKNFQAEPERSPSAMERHGRARADQPPCRPRRSAPSGSSCPNNPSRRRPTLTLRADGCGR